MKREPHTLSLKSHGRDPELPSVLLWDAECSCGKWKTQKPTVAPVARAMHMDHLQQLLGPEAQAAGLEGA